MDFNQRWLVIATLVTLLVAGFSPLVFADVDPSTSQAQELLLFSHNAMIEGRYKDVIRAKYIANARLQNKGAGGWSHYGDLLSDVWVAAGKLSLCPTNLEEDLTGARLSPLILFNRILRSMRRSSKVDEPSQGLGPFIFGQQKFVVHWQTLLTAEQIKSLRPREGECRLDQRWQSVDQARRQRSAMRQRFRPILRDLLATALGLNDPAKALDKKKVRGIEQLQTRRFAFILDALANSDDVNQDQEAQATLSEMKTYSTAQWLALNPKWRPAIIQMIRPHFTATEYEQLLLSLIDALILNKSGHEIPFYIDLLTRDAAARRPLIWAGDRGRRLLGLNKEHDQFSFRPIIALHRGVDAYRKNDFQLALENLTNALQWSFESGASATVQDSAKLYLSHIFAVYTVDERLLYLLTQILPKSDVDNFMDDLAWRAALHGDAKSLQMLSSLERRKRQIEAADALRSILVKRSWEPFQTYAAEGLSANSQRGLRQLKSYVDYLSREDDSIKIDHRQGLLVMQAMLTKDTKNTGSKRELLMAVDGLLRSLGTSSGEQQAMRHLSQNTEDGIPLGRIATPIQDDLIWPPWQGDVNLPEPFSPILIEPNAKAAVSAIINPQWTIVE